MNLKQRQDIIKDKRKQTSFRDYLKEIVSLRTLWFYKNNWLPSIYHDTDRIKWVISHKEFEETRDDLINQWVDYDFQKNFFDNFKSFFRSIKQPPTRLFEECDNANFSDQTVASKNCYLSYVVINSCENVLYSLSVKESSINILNSVLVRDYCENIYFSMGVIKSFKIFYSKYIQNSSDVRFSSNLVWCHECLFCNNLDNQSYYINNQKLEKDEYFKQKEKILSQKDNFMWRLYSLESKWNNISSENVLGDFNIQCQNIKNGYCNYQIKDWKNIILIWWKDSATNIYDCFLNTPPQQDYYWTFSAGYWDNIYNSYHIKWWSNVYYSVALENSSYCIWCVWLRNKQFCIFNKQYDKEERLKLANQIFAQMNQDGILGKFFPGSISPFYFNDSAAYLIDDSFTKEEVEAQWYLRRDDQIKVDIPEGLETISTDVLPKYQWFDSEWNWRINSEILKKVIIDKKWNSYRIIKMEYDFLVKHWLPLPDIHWLDRIKLWFKFT